MSLPFFAWAGGGWGVAEHQGSGEEAGAGPGSASLLAEMGLRWNQITA